MPSTCTCLQDLPKQITDNQPFIGLQVKHAVVKEATFMFRVCEYRTYSQIELTCEGRKRPVKHLMIHSFCPFCGKAYSEIPKEKEVPHV
jgi:hypothetical protein